MTLKSPYKHLGDQRVVVPFRVDPKEIAYVKTKYPYGHTAIIDTICSILFAKFVAELRTHEPFDSACFVNDPGYTILSDVLDAAFVERRSTGSGATGETGSRDGGRGADGIRQTVQRPTVVSPKPSRVRKGRPKAQDAKETEAVS